jgi:predicted transcriptional regulator
VPASELLRDVVGEFVQRTLAGSLSPFVTYLSEADDVSEEELKQLQDVVARLQSRKQRKE